MMNMFGSMMIVLFFCQTSYLRSCVDGFIFRYLYFEEPPSIVLCIYSILDTYVLQNLIIRGDETSEIQIDGDMFAFCSYTYCSRQ